MEWKAFYERKNSIIPIWDVIGKPFPILNLMARTIKAISASKVSFENTLNTLNLYHTSRRIGVGRNVPDDLIFLNSFFEKDKNSKTIKLTSEFYFFQIVIKLSNWC